MLSTHLTHKASPGVQQDITRAYPDGRTQTAVPRRHEYTEIDFKCE